MKKFIAPAAVAVGLLGVAAPAMAHVTLQPTEAPADGFTRLNVRVPNERDEASTTKVRVQFPPGFYSISYEPVAGWNVDVKMRKLDQPAELFGEKVNEEVDEVSISTSGAGIAPGQFRDFGLSAKMPNEPGKALTFKALQTYTGGEVVRWIGPPDADEPAPQVTLTAAEEVEAAAPAAAAEEAEDDDDGPSTGLVVVALILGALGLTAGIAGLMAARRARTG
ncbi:MAG: YcnI family protein [Thermoleophilaceae bacterium]